MYFLFRTPLHAAAYNDSNECLQTLIDHSADINVVNDNGMSPSMIAAKRGHQNIIGKLLLYCCPMDVCCDKNLENKNLSAS